MRTADEFPVQAPNAAASNGSRLAAASMLVALVATSCFGEPALVKAAKSGGGADSAATDNSVHSRRGARSRPSENKPFTLTLASNIVMELVWVPAGEFTMGSDACEAERPPHTVRLLKGFWMGRCEVTQEQYQAVTGRHPSRFKDAKNPVDSVSWSNAVEFTKLLTAEFHECGVFRLPTEAEWEYACGENCPLGWHSESSSMRVHKVEESKANRRGLYDMLGNVGEWCQDWYDMTYYRTAPDSDPTGPERGQFRVIRGGCWSDEWENCTPRLRNRAAPQNREDTTGFRVVLEQKKAGRDKGQSGER